MQNSRMVAALAALMAMGGPACAQTPSAPPAAAAPAADPASSDMMSLYQDYCLNRFPNQQRLVKTLDEHPYPPAAKAGADRALQGREGQVWAADQPHGKFLMAVWTKPQRGCAVIGTALNDGSMRATFDITVTVYAGDHELGPLARPPVQAGKIGGAPARMQALILSPASAPREAFINLAIANADHTTETRLVREVGSTPATPTPPPPGKP